MDHLLSICHNYASLVVIFITFQVKNRGVSIFLMQAGMLGTFQALWDVFPLFTNTGWGENANIGFLAKHMGASFEKRPQPWVTNVSVNDIQSGDFLAISKIRGRWGGFETLEKWVSGAYAGHSAVCLRDSEGKLWVGESGHENEKVIEQEFHIVVNCQHNCNKLLDSSIMMLSECFREKILLLYYHGTNGGSLSSAKMIPTLILHCFLCTLMYEQSLMRLLHGSMHGAWMDNHMVTIT